MMKNRAFRFATAVAVAVGLAGTALAAGQDGQDGAALETQAVKFDGTAISFDLPAGTHNVTVTVAGPRGFRVQQYFPDGDATIDLAQHGEVTDGRYKYEMTGASDEEVEFSSSADDSGRADDGSGRKPRKSMALFGGFRVTNGAILINDNLKETE